MELVTNGKTICLASSKGGVGKSIIATHMAGVLSKLNKKVLLIDLDVFNGGLSMFINENINKTIFNLTDDIANNRFKQIDNYVYKYNENISILCAPKDPRQGGKITSKYIDMIIEKSAREYDYVIIDTSASLSEVSLVALDIVDKIIFVTTSDIIAIKNLRNLINIFNDNNILNYKVLLNNSFNFTKDIFSFSEIKRIIGSNIDYLLTNDFFIKDINKYIYENMFPSLDKVVNRKYKTELKKIEMMLMEDENEEK